MGAAAVDRLDREVEAALRGSAPAAKKLVVAVSGGPDSLALLHALLHLRAPLGLKLHGAHLNHGLRGDAGAKDAAFVADSFSRAGIPYAAENADVASYRAAHRLSLEEAARDVRYAFLARVYGDQGTDAVVLGHTADDQAETILMHLIRGSGLSGLRGMETSSVRRVEGSEVPFVRPLLDVPRQDTEAYCSALGLVPRTDESNRSPDFTRNRIRTELLPLLEELNPAVRSALVRLSRTAARELSYLDAVVDGVWSDASELHDDRAILDRRAVNRLAPAPRAHLLRRAIAAVKSDLDGVRLQHIDEMMRLLEGSAGRFTHLPGGLRFHVGYDDAVVATADAELCPLPPLDGEHELAVPGETDIGDWNVITRLVDQRMRGSSPTDLVRPAAPLGGLRQAPVELTARLSYRAVAAQVTVRSRRPGDRVQPLGMAGHKKLQDFMVDAKIPESWRDRVPLLVTPRGIAWVAGYRIANWARVTPDDTRVFEIILRNQHS